MIRSEALSCSTVPSSWQPDERARKITRAGRGVVFLFLCVLLVGSPDQARGGDGDPIVINLYVEGPRPQKLEVTAGTAVLWVSHLTHTSHVVVTVTFPEGLRVTQATQAVQGYDGFVTAGHNFIGRMRSDGGQVALRFVTPGTYTYRLDYAQSSGTIVVR